MSAFEHGWFADWDADGQGWQPNLQLDGMALPVEVWFKTEDECAAWIRDALIPAASKEWGS